MKILVTPTSLCSNKTSGAMALLEPLKAELVFNPFGRPLTEDEVIPLLNGVDGYLAGLDHITQKVIEHAPASLRVISRYGTGFERVDIKAAGKQGIRVTNTPGVNSEAVADLVFGLILAVARKIPSLDRQVRSGEWPRTVGVELFGKTIGIVGLGAIGRRVAQRAHGFSMKVVAYDPFMDIEAAKAVDAEPCDFSELCHRSDFVSLHVPLTDQTRNLFNDKVIAGMKHGAIIINTSRGGLIDENAAYDALISGRLGGLGLDAFEHEPPKGSKLLLLDTVVATPHAGAHTAEAIHQMGMLSAQNLVDVLTGNDCRFVVNKEYLVPNPLHG